MRCDPQDQLLTDLAAAGLQKTTMPGFPPPSATFVTKKGAYCAVAAGMIAPGQMWLGGYIKMAVAVTAVAGAVALEGPWQDGRSRTVANLTKHPRLVGR